MIANAEMRLIDLEKKRPDRAIDASDSMHTPNLWRACVCVSRRWPVQNE
jgi:hypothetical protein